uniref:Uncharacterized protein n=1 Tax=Glossina pallidipes TaxID=7398 RepID=A0A1B0AF46_GLOPL
MDVGAKILVENIFGTIIYKKTKSYHIYGLRNSGSTMKTVQKIKYWVLLQWTYEVQLLKRMSLFQVHNSSRDSDTSSSSSSSGSSSSSSNRALLSECLYFLLLISFANVINELLTSDLTEKPQHSKALKSNFNSVTTTPTQHRLQTYPSHPVDDDSVNQSEDNIKPPAMITRHVHTHKRKVPPPDLQPTYQYCGVSCEHLKRVGNDIYCLKFHIFLLAGNPETTFRVYAYAHEVLSSNRQLNMDAHLINPISNYKDSK